MIPTVFLGLVERVTKVGKPGARLRPLFQAAPDKKSWIPTEDEFPNSGVISWWDPPPDLKEDSIWTFHVEPSRSFEPSLKSHDAFMVKGTPLPALQLIVLPEVDDLEDARELLVERGLPLERCASLRLFFRVASGLTVGPLDFTARNGRLYVNERDGPLPLYEPSDDISCGKWNGHFFLPIEALLHKVGEVDFSSNAAFLEHVLREAKELPSELLKSANLTNAMISQYAAALDKVCLTPLKAQRLKRLRKLREHATLGIKLGETAVSDVLSLPAVKELISSAREAAVRSALEESGVALVQLDERRKALEGEVEELRTEAASLRAAIASSTKEQDALLNGFDAQIHHKFEEIGRNATAFLAQVAVLRAALTATDPEKVSVKRSMTPRRVPDLIRPSADQVVKTLRGSFEAAGLGSILPSVLLSSWASGYLPTLYGVLALDVLKVASEALFGGAIHLATLGPMLTSPKDLLAVAAASRFGVDSIGQIAESVAHSDDVALLVLDSVNLAQLDSVVLPLLRSYAEFHSQCPSEVAPMQYATPLGMWPRNLLLAGVLIDSPLALPMSREIWTYATFVDASSRRICPSAKIQESRTVEESYRLPHETWTDWLRTIKSNDRAGTDLIAAHLTRNVESSSLFKRMCRLMADAIDNTASGLSDEKRAGLLVEMLLPYLLSRDVAPESVLENAPGAVSTQDGFIDFAAALFEKWGLGVR